jgi:hypothetical protein
MFSTLSLMGVGVLLSVFAAFNCVRPVPMNNPY